MKKIISIILSLAMVLSMSATAFAAEQTLPMQPANSDGFIEITEEYIEKYGVHTVDEFGNKIIEVPLGPDMSYISDPITTDEEVHEGIHEGHSYPEGMIQPYHFSLTPHSHEVVNVTSVQYSNYIPVTQYAMAGFTISKEYNETVEVNASLNLNGGISKSSVEGSLGVSVGGSYTRGSGESYSATVPSGYRGRIAYRYYSTLYMFDNKTSYIWSSYPLVITEEFDACSAESAPYDGYFYMQLLATN